MFELQFMIFTWINYVSQPLCSDHLYLQFISCEFFACCYLFEMSSETVLMRQGCIATTIVDVNQDFDRKNQLSILWLNFSHLAEVVAIATIKLLLNIFSVLLAKGCKSAVVYDFQLK